MLTQEELVEVVFALRLPSETASVPVIRGLCRTNLEHLGVDSECIDDISLAVTEACANAVVHSAGAEDFGVQVTVSGLRCEIEVRDWGRGFDPADVSRSHGMAESGRGIELMRMLVDELHYEPDGSGTAVTLVKVLRLAEDSPLQTLALG